MSGGHRADSELDDDIAGADQRADRIADREADAAETGKLTEIGADMGTPRLGGAARQRAALGRGDLGQQHPAHASAAADDPHLYVGHARPPESERRCAYAV